MDSEQTLEIELPPGTRPNPDSVTTQEIPVLTQQIEEIAEVTEVLPAVEPIAAFPDVKLTVPVRVDVPWTRVSDPIMTMPPPAKNDTPLFDQIYGPPPKKPMERKRRKLVVADKVLIGMAGMALVGAVGVYGMVAYGWGAGDMPKEEAAKAPVKPSQTTSAPKEYSEPSKAPERPHKAVEKPRKAVPVAAPETYVPAPEKSIVVVSPTPTPEPTRTTEAPAPPTTHPAPPPVTEEPTPTPTPTPTETVEPSPTLSVTVPPVTDSASAPIATEPTSEQSDA